MAEIRETEVERDAEGRVIGYTEREVERPKRRGGGFGWGFFLGLLVIVGAVAIFAYSEGSFQSAGREADQVTAQAEQQLEDRGVQVPDAALPRDEASIPNSGTVSN